MTNRAKKEPRWLTRGLLDVIHADQLHQHGGSVGVRDGGLIESALARPRNRWVYEKDMDLADLAAAYALGLANNHGYVDGNTRVAFMALYVFLRLNGQHLTAPEPEVVLVMLNAAAGILREPEVAQWIRSRLDEHHQ